MEYIKAFWNWLFPRKYHVVIYEPYGSHFFGKTVARTRTKLGGYIYHRAFSQAGYEVYLVVDGEDNVWEMLTNTDPYEHQQDTLNEL